MWDISFFISRKNCRSNKKNKIFNIKEEGVSYERRKNVKTLVEKTI